MAKVTMLNNILYIDNVAQQQKEGIYIFGAYQMKDSDKNGFADSVEFEPIEAYAYYMVSADPPQWKLDKLGSEVMSDFVPGETTGAETGGYPAELIAIEQERAEREKEAHRQLHGTGKMTITDVMGNTEEVTEGYYLAVREHKVLENQELQFGLNGLEVAKKVALADRYANMSREEFVNKGGLFPSISEQFFNVELTDENEEFGDVSIPAEVAKKFFTNK